MRERIRAALHAPDAFRRLRDFAAECILRVLPVHIRKRIFGGSTHFCPVCSSGLRGFLVLNRDYLHWCPVCWSLQRHRLVWHFLNSAHIDIATKPRRMLHIAPEPGFAARFRAMKNISYLNADLYARDAMVRMDVCNIQYSDASFDLLYCSHVLEHVQDDRAAMREFWRVLSPTGEAVLLVPQKTGPTLEDGAVIDPIEREKKFGQHDHVRVYGDDFGERLSASGFRVIAYHSKDLLAASDAQRMGIDPDCIYLCTKKL